jgi:hypothetical protein
LYGLVHAFGRVGWGIIFFRIYNANRDRTIIEPLSSVSRGIREWRGVPACSRITIFAASECLSAVSPYRCITKLPYRRITILLYRMCHRHIASPTASLPYRIAMAQRPQPLRHGGDAIASLYGDPVAMDYMALQRLRGFC